jgi:hypothetical protein
MERSTVPPRVTSGAESPRWNVGRKEGMFGMLEADMELRDA